MAAQQYYFTPTNLKYCDDDDDSSDTNKEVSDDDDDDNCMEEDEDEKEQHSSSPSLVGSDEEYNYEADHTDFESGAAPKRRSKSRSSASRANPNKNTINSSGGRLRVWNEEEEIILLRCKISCNTENFYTEIQNLLPHKKRSQITDKLRRLKDKFQKHKGNNITNSHDKKLHDLSNRVWGDISDTNTSRQKENSMNVDDAEDMVQINDDAVVKQFDEYLSSRKLEINEKDRMKLVKLWRKVSYYKATHKLALVMFASDLQNYKVHGYDKC